MKTGRASALGDLRVNEKISLFFLDHHSFKLLWLELLEVFLDEFCGVEANTGISEGRLDALLVI